ncbi:MAG: hypothetical protein PHR77_14185 [Kiritimatiellae bacterium]|nr:hypothetical protein [Kiritimatiellia bacterium]MDD5519416.1 hypothetical protein [Kiritimatiellia bacterium]
MKIWFITVILLVAGLLDVYARWGVPPDDRQKLEIVGDLIDDVESTVKNICRDADAGKFKSGHSKSFGGKYDWLPAATLSFSKSTFEEDMDKAVAYIDKLENIRRDLQAMTSKEEKAGRNKGPVSRKISPEDALMKAESRTGNSGTVEINPESTFNVLDSYSGDRKSRQAEKDRMAEADMKRVIEERRLAEAEKRVKEEAERKTMEQNARWQAELDSQAVKTAQEEEAWKREHSAGAFFKNLARTTVGGTVSALTGGLAQSIGSGVADLILRKRFDGFRPSGEYDRRYYDSSGQPIQQ